MPLKTADVIATLNDPVALGIMFIAGPTFVSGVGYVVVRDSILNGNIMVLEGDPQQNLAFYNPSTDTLTTQGTANPPAGMDDRAQLLHECTHALIDINGPVGMTRHLGELTAYIAQFVYETRSDPWWTVPPNNVPWQTFYQGIVDLIHAKNLHKLEGNGAILTAAELEPLRLQLIALPGVTYGTYGKDVLAGADGVDRTLWERMMRKAASGLS